VLLGVAVAAAVAVRPAEVRARAGTAIVFTLKKEFIEAFKNRVTIEADVSVVQCSPIHPDKDDGEIHISGSAPQVGLPFVAEIMHAKTQKKAVRAAQRAEGQAPVKVKGAWRIWCEHADGVNQTQGESGDPIVNSNPPHVFEIHPVSQFAGLDVLDSIGAPINFKFKKPDVAFTHYENVGCKITDNGDTVSVRTSMAGYNIPEFILESVDDAVGGKEVEDGRFLFAAVRDLDGELLVRKVRMAFIKGTDVEVAARRLAKGQRMHVAGIPRVSLALISFRVEHKNDPHDPLTWNLPYEVIVVGTVDD
jgi:hypothetical protein